jgi:radical SAM superfamily enzyme YgiQ (UPF0313 family)
MYNNRYPYELGPIRPVAEAQSLLIRVTRGCPWNRCEFCTSYKSKDIEFSTRSVEEIKNDVDRAFEYYKGYEFKTCFLQDGDIFCLPSKDIIEIVSYIKDKFPSIEKITSYGIVHKIAKKSFEELEQIYKAGLNRVYCGMESGSDKVLRLIKKGSTSQMLIDVGKNVKKAGIELSYFIIMGIGGRQYLEENAIETARVLNEVNPDYIRVRTIRVKPGSGLNKKVESNEFIIPSEEDMVKEQLLFLENLNVTSYYDNDHRMNLLMEVFGKLPEDKDKMIAILKKYLSLPDDEKTLFNYGVRLNVMYDLKDLNNEILRQKIMKNIDLVRKEFNYSSEEKIMNDLRVIFTSS